MEARTRGHRQFSLKTKLLLMTSTVMIVAIFVVSCIFYNNSCEQTTRLLQKQALAIARAASLLVDGDEFERISYSLNSQDPYYKEVLMAFKKLNRKLNSGMLYAITDSDYEHYTYVIDGSGTVDIGFKQQKEDFSEEAYQAIREGKEYTCRPYYVKTFDKHYLSAFVPIFNSSKEVVGVIEYDYEEYELADELRRITVFIILVAILLICAVLVINYLLLIKFFKPMEHLVDSIREVAKGDLTVQMDLKGTDEIGMINQAVNETIQNIHGILEKIKYSSKKVNIASKSILVSSRDAAEVYEELAVSTSGISDVVQKQGDRAEEIKKSIEILQKDTLGIRNEINGMDELLVSSRKRYEESLKSYGEQQIKISGIKKLFNKQKYIMDSLLQHISQINGVTTSILNVSREVSLLTLQKDTEETARLTQQADAAVHAVEEMMKYLSEEMKEAVEIMTEISQMEQGKLESMIERHLEELDTEHNKLNQKIISLDQGINEVDEQADAISRNLKEIEEVSKSIELSTTSLLAITQEQVATSEEFKAMAELLRQQAKKLDESLAKFTV